MQQWRTLFTLRAIEASFVAREFLVSDVGVQRALERVGEIFIAGFNRSIMEGDSKSLWRFIDSVDADHRGFAVEGAAMGAGIVDALMLGRGRLRIWLELAGEEFTYLAHVGAGWALARVPWRRRAIMDCLDPIHCWLAYDGFGFHDGYFHASHIICGWRRLRTGYAARTYDQGVGRAIWFIAGGSVERAVEVISRLDPARHSDLWAGLGLALGYAGGAGPQALHHVARAAGALLPALAQGVAFAAEARARAHHVPASSRAAIRILSGLDAEEAAQLVRRVRASLPPAETGGTPRYELWRNGVQSALGSAGGMRHA
jgi:hypothetical protein